MKIHENTTIKKGYKERKNRRKKNTQRFPPTTGGTVKNNKHFYEHRMHGIGSNHFQGIEQTDDSLYSSRENDESDTEPGKLIFHTNYRVFFYIAIYLNYLACCNESQNH